MNKKWNGLLLAIALGMVVYGYGWTIKYKYEPEYWENFYYHSQWNIPNSTRKISDDGLYQFVGYRLAEGENPFDISYEVPPLGKYLYGLSAKFLGNPYLTSLGLYGLLIVTMFRIAKYVYRQRELEQIATLLVFSNPLMVQQLGLTMLDLPLAVMFLAHFLFLIKYKTSFANKDLLISGAWLGLATGTKVPFYVPMVFLVDSWFLFRLKKIDKIWLFVISGLVGYMASFFCYFVKHPNPIPWIRLHSKMVGFYLNGWSNQDVANMFRAIFIGKFRQLWTGRPDLEWNGWSIILPIGTIGLVFILTRFGKIIRQNLNLAYLTLIGSGYLLATIYVDFWPRYLVPIIPILTLISVWWLKKKLFLLKLIVISQLVGLLFLLRIGPNESAKNWVKYLSTDAYRESYRLLTDKDKLNYPEDDWQQMTNWGGKEIEIIKIDDKKFSNQAKLITSIGPFEMKKENNLWRVRWNNEIKIERDDSTIDGNEVWVIPHQIDNWGEIISALASTVDADSEEIVERLYSVVPDVYPIKIGSLKDGANTENLQKFRAVRIGENE